jgi:hypothetical protein
MARGVGYDGPVDIETSQRIYPNLVAAVDRSNVPTTTDA